MEVLSNGLKQNFWIPIEEHPDVDRFIDEDITVTIDNFKIKGVLLKVATCKKKDSNGDFEYFKQLTIDVNTISCGDSAIRVPIKKEEFQHEMDFHYVDMPQELESDEPDDDEILAMPSDEEIAAVMEEADKTSLDELDIDAETEMIQEIEDELEGPKEDLTSEDITDAAEKVPGVTSVTVIENADEFDDDDFDFDDETDQVADQVEAETETEPDDEDDEFDKMFEDETADDPDLVDENGDPDDLEPDTEPATADADADADFEDDDDGIDWGE
jgi:hypothetical protein